MSRKNLIICISLVAVLVIGIIYGIASLYKGEGGSSIKTPGSYPLLQAVPSDAALVMHFKNLDKALDILTDSTMAFSGIGGSGKEDFDAFIRTLSKDRKDLGSLKNKSAALALMFSGNMVPLLIVESDKSTSDSLYSYNPITALADSVKLYSSVSTGKSGRILVSTSETVVKSSERHSTNGVSVLNSDGMAEVAAKASGDNVVFINCSYSGKLLSSHFTSKYNKYSDLFKKLGQWVALSIDDSSSKHVAMSGFVGSKISASSFMNLASNAPSGDIKVAEVLPSETFAFMSIPTGNIKDYLSAREKYLDANGKLDKYKATNQAYKKETGSTASDWAQSIGLKEAAIAWLLVDNGLEGILLIRSDNRKGSGEIQPNLRPGALACLLGEVFSLEDESCIVSVKGWDIIGSQKTLSTYLADGYLNNTIKLQMGDCNLSGRISSKNSNFMLYLSIGSNPAILSDIFRKDAAEAFKSVIKGVGFTPAVLTVNDGKSIHLDVDRLNITKSKAPIVERDTTVVVPEGPFKVQNSGTGQTNNLYQNSNLYICLQEESGKGIWGIPFKEKICGTVECIDWYNNGKIQFLFGAGSKLYLLDRTGKFVNPFPTELGKDILIGPAAYDFTGAHGYTAVVLHKDNTIEMYNLHGKKPDNWLGITSSETIKGLPELLTIGKKKYWIVRTSIQSLVFGFYGGEPLTKSEGDKMIRPDSKITANDNGSISATCYDGKERNFKLEKEK